MENNSRIAVYFNVISIIIRITYKFIRVASTPTQRESHSLIVSLNFKYGTN